MDKNNQITHLRNATEQDSELLAVICESNIDLYEPLIPGAFAKQANKFRSKGISTGYDIQIIEHNSRGVGFVGTLRLTKNKTYLVALYLLHSTQRNGLGHKVMKQIMRQIKLKNTEAANSEILLLVHKEAIWAINFYTKLGFQVIGNNAADITTYNSGLLKDLYIPNTYLMTLKL